MKCAELLITNDRFEDEDGDLRTRDVVEECLGSNLFLSVGTLYISTDYDDYDDPYGFDDDDSDPFDPFVTEMLSDIYKADNLPLECLKLSGRQVDPDALGKAVCKISVVELNELGWLGPYELELFLKQIIACEDLVLKSLTLKTSMGSWFDDDDMFDIPDALLRINPNLLGLVAVRMKYFKARVTVEMAEAILLVICESKYVELQDLQLYVWLLENNNDRRNVTKKMRLRHQEIEEREDFVDIYEEEMEIIKSKVKNVIIRVNEDDYE